MTVAFVLNGAEVSVDADTTSLLDVLREQLGVRSVKDGCSPQGQCGCCTVLVDGAPRVSCVTPVRRIAGRSVTTIEGLADETRDAWAEAFCGTGASQCGFCTPGIIVRLEGLREKQAASEAAETVEEPEVDADPAPKSGPDADAGAVDRALAAHLCRCTGWQTIREAYAVMTHPDRASGSGSGGRDLVAAATRAALEGHGAQRVDPSVACGEGGFADDTAPGDALVAVPDGAGGWAVGETLAEAHQAAGKVQGRRTTVEARPPIDLPAGAWDLVLQTGWVEPAYLETDASWCQPGGEPASPLANGGAFGGKVASPAPAAARELADRHGRAVRVLLSREDTVRTGAKRPPIAAGLRTDGTGTIRIARTPGVADLLAEHAPGLVVEEVDLVGPPTSLALRAAGWAEAAVLAAAARHLATGAAPRSLVEVEAPNGARAAVSIVAGEEPAQNRVAAAGGPAPIERIDVVVACGDVLDPIVLRSYVIGATHMALGWVTTESLAVDDDGTIGDLTIRSFGIRRASEMPDVHVELVDARAVGAVPSAPINGSDAVFAAVAAAVWIHSGLPPVWPTRLSR